MNSLVLEAVSTSCLAVAIGIFFMLYCIEKPIYSAVFGGHVTDYSGEKLTQVLLALKQFRSSGVPRVMGSLIIIALLSSIANLLLYRYNMLQLIMVISVLVMISTFGMLVPPAIRKMLSGDEAGSAMQMKQSLAPLVKLHIYGGLTVIFMFFLQFMAVVYYK